jgi:hypothetical protein
VILTGTFPGTTTPGQPPLFPVAHTWLPFRTKKIFLSSFPQGSGTEHATRLTFVNDSTFVSELLVKESPTPSCPKALSPAVNA